MEILKFYRRKEYAVLLAALYGVLFLVSTIVVLIFCIDLFTNIKLSKLFYAILLCVIPLFLVSILGFHFVKYIRNTDPVCTISNDKLIFTEFVPNGKGTFTENLFYSEIKEITLKKYLLENKISINLKLTKGQNKTLTYLSSFLSEKDKLLMINAVEKKTMLKANYQST